LVGREVVNRHEECVEEVIERINRGEEARENDIGGGL
jgi:exo-beta-1,3-glucanase (GH17 family)